MIFNIRWEEIYVEIVSTDQYGKPDKMSLKL